MVEIIRWVVKLAKLNNLVEQYKNETDIIFLSLGIDNSKQLKVLLRKINSIIKPLQININYSA